MTTPDPALTDEMLGELRALEAKATPGPWTADEFAMADDHSVRICTTDGSPLYYHTSATIAEAAYHANRQEPSRGERYVSWHEAEQNAALIAAARNALPALISAASRTLADEEHLEAWRQQAREWEVRAQAAEAEVERLRTALDREGHYRRILAVALAKIKSTLDGRGDQTVREIVEGCIDATAAAARALGAQQ